MELILKDILIFLLTSLSAVVMFVIRRVFQRLEKLEEQQKQYLTKSDIRSQIEDKVSPLQDRMQRIESKIDDIINILMNR